MSAAKTAPSVAETTVSAVTGRAGVRVEFAEIDMSCIEALKSMQHVSERSSASVASGMLTYLPQCVDIDALGSLDWSVQQRVHGEVVMTDLKNAITVGGTRLRRHAGAVAGWGLRQATGRPGVRYDIVGTCGG
jgi:hypothetical protein